MEIPVVSNERNVSLRRIDGKASSFATVLGVERNANNSYRLTVHRRYPWRFFTHNGSLLEERRGEGPRSLIDSVWCDIRTDLFALSTVLVITRLSGTHISLPVLAGTAQR